MDKELLDERTIPSRYHLPHTDPWKVLLAAVLLVLCWYIRHAILLIWVSIIFAVILSPAIAWIQHLRIRRWHPSRGIALLLLLATVTAAITVFSFLAFPPIISDSQALFKDLPQNLTHFQTNLRRLPFGDFIAKHLGQQQLGREIGTIFTGATSVVQGFKTTVTSLFTVLLLTMYFILDGEQAFRWVLKLISRDNRDRVCTTALRASSIAQKWLLGQLILMAILGGFTTVVLGLLGVRYFYALGVLAGIANFIPVLGPILTVVVASAVAAIDSWVKVLGVLAFYFAYQQVENAYLTPKIVGARVGLPGVGVLIALLIGAELAGVLGALVAVPTAVIVTAFIDEYLRRDEPTHELPSSRAA